VRPVTDSRAHDPKRLLLDWLLRARTPLVSKPSTPHPRFNFDDEPKRATVTRELSHADRAIHAVFGTAVVCALHRFTRARRTATVRGVSVKLLRARPRGLGLPYGFRAPRPRCTQPASTHPSFRPREPVTSCVPGFLPTLAGAASAASLARPFSPLRAWRHRRPSHGAEASLPRGTMRRAPGGLDLPMRETREKRVSRHAHRFGQPP